MRESLSGLRRDTAPTRLLMNRAIRSQPDTDAASHRYADRRRTFWDEMASRPQAIAASYYHRRITAVYQQLVPTGLKVLELGCGEGDLLAAVHPTDGVGVDFSSVAIEAAREKHPNLNFILGDVHVLELNDTFDVVIISDLANDVWDVQRLLDVVGRVCHPGTRVILNLFNRLWQLPIGVARAAGFAQPMLKQNWLSLADIRNLLELAGFEVVTTSGEIIWPIRTPIVDVFSNRFLVKLWPFSHLALTHFVVARPHPRRVGSAITEDAFVSVVVPARNEAGHIREILERTPNMGSRTEIIFVEGNSTDDTLAVIAEAVEELNTPDVRYYVQPGIGKGDAVRWGYQHAKGDVLMILDADMTVAPEDLTRFFEAIADGSGEFINGVRLVYPMEEQAMQFLNYLGNKIFSWAFTWLLGQPVKDTLCGTKVISRTHYDLMATHRSYFGDFDPFGDFDLLFGATKSNLKIVDIPIRYRDRRYGSTNIDRWRHGWLLIRMAVFAARKLRFI